MATYKTNAIVLRRIPFGETDKIVTIFAREYGKFNIIAKGARRTTSRLCGATEPLMLIKGMLAEGMNLDVLTQCDIKESFPALRADFGLYLRATYCCELLDRLSVERDPDSETFDLLLSTLYILQRAADPDAAVHSFELKLMGLAGYAPQMDACLRCDDAFEAITGQSSGIIEAAYSPMRGGALCDRCAEATREEVLPLSPDAAMWIRRLAAEENARAMAEILLPPDIRHQMNRALRSHLKLRLERDVRSTAFLDAYRVGAMEHLNDPLPPEAR